MSKSPQEQRRASRYEEKLRASGLWEKPWLTRVMNIPLEERHALLNRFKELHRGRWFHTSPSRVTWLARINALQRSIDMDDRNLVMKNDGSGAIV